MGMQVAEPVWPVAFPIEGGVDPAESGGAVEAGPLRQAALLVHRWPVPPHSAETFARQYVAVWGVRPGVQAARQAKLPAWAVQQCPPP